MWFTEKRYTHHSRKGTHATMKTAKAIEETLRENLEKIEKNTATKPKQRYLTFGNVTAFALAILVIWGVLSGFLSLQWRGEGGAGMNWYAVSYKFHTAILHPLYLMSYPILVLMVVCVFWIADWDKDKTCRTVTAIGVTLAGLIMVGVCTAVPLISYQQSAAASCFALNTGYNEATVYENNVCFKEKKILVAEQIIRATNVEEKTKNIDGQYVEGTEYFNVNGTGETLFVPDNEKVVFLSKNLEEISKTSDGHAYYSTPLNTKDPSAKKSVLTKVSVQTRKTPVENNAPINDSIIIDGKTYKYSHKIETGGPWYMVDLYIPEGENLNG